MVVLLDPPDPLGADDPDDLAERALGPCESAALDAALRLRSGVGGTVAVIGLGPAERTLAALRLARDRGGDRGLHILAPECADLDYLGCANVLAEAIHRIGCDLVLCGDRTRDGGANALGPAVAEVLGLPHLSAVLGLDTDPGDSAPATESATAAVAASIPEFGGEPAPEDSGAGEGIPVASSSADAQTTPITRRRERSDTFSSPFDSGPTMRLPRLDRDAPVRVAAAAVRALHRGSGRLHRLRFALPSVLCVLGSAGADPAEASPPARDEAAAPSPADTSPSPAPAPPAQADTRPAPTRADELPAPEPADPLANPTQAPPAQADTVPEPAAPPSAQAPPRPIIEELTLVDLGLDARALAHRSRLRGVVVALDPAPAALSSSADELVARLVADGLLR